MPPKPKHRPCMLCGKQRKYNTIKYCSRSCASRGWLSDPSNHPNWKGGMILEYSCAQCNVSFKRKRADVWGKRQFCSYSCRSIFTICHNKTKGTDIENAMEQILKEMGVRYIPQHAFPGIGISDFFLPKQNVAIFCDGEYWHNFPNGKPRDAKQIELLSERGIYGFRFWGKDILSGNVRQALLTAVSFIPSS